MDRGTSSSMASADEDEEDRGHFPVILCVDERNLSFQLHKTALGDEMFNSTGTAIFFLLLLQKKIITIKMSNLEKKVPL